MQRNSLYDFVFFGTAFRYLSDLQPNPDFRSEGGPLSNIHFVLDFLENNNMQVSRNAAQNLYAVFEELEGREDDDVSLDEAFCGNLRRILQEIRMTVLAEAQEVRAFFPNEKRYNTEFLFSDIGQIVGKDTYDALPENARRDLDEAGKCILLERSTAAAFHLMRGAERTLKHLYFCVIKRGRHDNLTWGSMTNHLDQRGALNEALKGTLDNFRRGFRNPTAHPDKFYSVDEAQDLMGTTSQLLALIASHPRYQQEE